MSKFFVGQRVEYVGKSELCVQKCHLGKKGTIAGVNYLYMDCFNVVFDDGTSNMGTYPENLKPIKPNNASPIRTVTRREIVPGVYGALEVTRVYKDGVNICANPGKWSDTELREAAHILVQLAEVLEDE